MTALASSGLRARMESLDLLANNIANSTTGGYKADREFYSLYVAPEAGNSDSPAAMPVIQREWTDFGQGEIRSTGNPLDVALDGRGFLAATGPGGLLYTRNGNLRLAADGTLTTQEGYPVRNAQGGTLTLDGARAVHIASDGTVTQDGAVIGQLQLADFTSSAGLTKQGANYFRVADPSQRVSPTSTSVVQGRLEGSNAGSAEGAVRLVSVMRQFEMLQKAVTLGADMGKRAIEEVAKV